MVDAGHLGAGYASPSKRAQAVREYFEGQGVPASKLSVNDSERPVVAVQEGRSADLSRSEFSAFMRASNALVNDDGGCRFATPEEKCVIVPYEYADDKIMSQNKTPADAGENLDDPSTIENERFAVMHHGGNRFSVLDRESGDGEDKAPLVYRVDMDAKDNGAMIQTPDGQPEVENGNERNSVVAAVIEAAPSYRPGPQESLTVNVGGAGGGNGSTGSSGGSSGSDTGQSDVDPVSDPGSDHEYDPEALIENVGDWLSNYASVKGDMIDGAWDLEFKKLTNPQNGQSDLGVHIVVEPFAHGVWDNDSGSWASDDAKERWSDHSAAMRSIFSSDDDPVKGFSVETDDEYDDWYNYVPADEAADL